jgi:hypothetical protein
VIAVTPMVAALASGIPFQGSIGWAMSVIEKSQQSIQVEENTSTKPTNSHWSSEDGSSDIHDPEESIPEDDTPVEDQPESSWLKRLYEGSFTILYRADRAAVLAACVVLGVLISVICHIAAMIKRKAAVGDDPFCGYLFLAAAELVFMTMFAAPNLGLLVIIQIDRLCTMTHILTIATVVVPVDLIMTLIEKKGSRMVMDICATVLCIGMCISVIAMGEYHSYLYYVATRYTAAAEVTHQIIQNMKPESFTIISPVDELYQVKGHGYHEESVQFIREIKKENYYLPTEYVFVFVEKQPLLYAHSHLPDGPLWLAKQEYQHAIGGPVSQSPDVLHSEISEEYANSSIVIPIVITSIHKVSIKV